MPDSTSAEPLPDYNALRKAGKPPRFTNEFRRLFWNLQGPLTTAVFVMDDEDKPEPREPYFRQTLSGITWHPVSQVSITEPKVASITVIIDELDLWQDGWEEYHQHAEPGDDFAVFGEDKDGEEVLLKCCGDDRPKDPPSMVVRALEKPYVTIHDYLSTVHPWLLGLRSDILRAMNVLEGEPLPAETKLMVNYDAPDRVKFEEEEHWFEQMSSWPMVKAAIEEHYGGPPLVSSTSQPGGSNE